MLSWLEGLKFTVPTNEIFEHSLRVWPGRSDVEAGDVAPDFQLLPLITAALVPLQVDIRGFRFPNMIESCRKKQMKHSEVSKAKQ